MVALTGRVCMLLKPRLAAWPLNYPSDPHSPALPLLSSRACSRAPGAWNTIMFLCLEQVKRAIA